MPVDIKYDKAHNPRMNNRFDPILDELGQSASGVIAKQGSVRIAGFEIFGDGGRIVDDAIAVDDDRYASLRG